MTLQIASLRRDDSLLCRTHIRMDMGVQRLAVILQTHMLFWSVTLLVMLEDDAAMLAFMFC